MATRPVPQDSPDSALPADPAEESVDLVWLERTLTAIMRRLMDSEDLDMPLLQLPLAQMRLAQALYTERETTDAPDSGETMGRLSERLHVRQNALTQAADRLVNHGLAERLSDPADRRIVRLRLTPTGAAWVHERHGRRRARYEYLWSLLDSQERTEFLKAVRVMEAAGNRLPFGRLTTASLPDTATPDTITGNPSDPPTKEERLSPLSGGEAVINGPLS